MTDQEKAKLRKQLKAMEIAAELEVKRQLAAEALEDLKAMVRWIKFSFRGVAKG